MIVRPHPQYVLGLEMTLLKNLGKLQSALFDRSPELTTLGESELTLRILLPFRGLDPAWQLQQSSYLQGWGLSQEDQRRIG